MRGLSRCTWGKACVGLLVVVLAVGLTLAYLCRLTAQDFAITDLIVDAEQARVQYQSEPGFYYILYAGTSVTQIVAAADMELGAAAHGELSDEQVLSTSDRAFYRVRRVPVTNAVDSDSDGYDDLFELRTPFMDPLAFNTDTDSDGMADAWEDGYGLSYTNPLDAAGDLDSDGVSNALEFAILASPTEADTDGDTYQDGYENFHGSDASDANSFPAPTLYVGAAGATQVGVQGVSDGSVTNPFTAIQFALNAAVEYDIIQVADGTYTGNNNKNLNFAGNALMLKSENGWDACVIDCEGLGMALYFDDDEDIRSVVEGFTICRAQSSNYGAIYFRDADATLQNCLIQSNVVDGAVFCDRSDARLLGCVIQRNEGRGFCTYSGDPVIEDCLIVENTHAYRDGPGAYCYGGNPTFRGCRILWNTTGGDGGGVYINQCDAGAPTFENCLIAHNEAVGYSYGGGGLCLVYSSPTLQNCTIVNNTAHKGSGGVECGSFASPAIKNCIVWGNVPSQVEPSTIVSPVVTYSDVQGGYAGEGNIDQDPRLTSYALRLTPTSPCIDAGTAADAPIRDIDNEARVDDESHPDVVSIVDMGMDEYVDSDGDGLADFWEREHFGDLSHSGLDDNDAEGGPDGLTDQQEYEAGTDPNKADTDNDGLQDGTEVLVTGTSPLDADTDDDRLLDGWEHGYGLDPLNDRDFMTDPDGDRIGAYYEWAHGTDPTNASSVPDVAFYVDASAPPGGDGSETTPFNTIQAAINASSTDHDIIQLAEGVYTGTGNKNVRYYGKILLLVSETGPEACVIDCQNSGQGFRFQDYEDRRSALRGVTIRNGNENNGGAIYCYYSSAWVGDCVMENNQAYSGGAVYASNSDASFMNCTMVGNHATYAGGAVSHAGPILLQNCAIANNTAEWSGGAIESSGKARVENCTITGNASAASEGGGIHGGSPILRNCILWGNEPDQLTSPTPTVEFCHIQQHMDTDWDIPIATDTRKTRTQIIYLGNNIGTSGPIDSVAMYISDLPGEVLEMFTIRMKHTDLDHYSVLSWEGSEWTLFYQDQNQVLNQTGWWTFHAQTSFVFNVESNLMVDISFANYWYSDGGTVRARDSGAARTLYCQVSSDSYGSPLTWSGAAGDVPQGYTETIAPLLIVDVGGNEVVVPVDAAAASDPLFVAGGYRLKAGSPCIDAGTATDAPAADIEGESRWDDPAHSNVVSATDIGADEFVDTDSDGAADAWEIAHFGNLTQTGSADNDLDGGPDGLTLVEEYENGTDPNKADTDGDGLSDGAEIHTHRTSPLDADSDDDGVSDGNEIAIGSDPGNPFDVEITNPQADRAFFDPDTNVVEISFGLNRTSLVTVSVFEIQSSITFMAAVELTFPGPPVWSSTNLLAPGAHMVAWNGTDTGGTPLAEGGYVYTIEAETALPYVLRARPYAPEYIPGPVSIENGSIGTSYWFRANEPMRITYDMTAPGMAFIATKARPYPALWGDFRDAGHHEEDWDGRGYDGDLLYGSFDVWAFGHSIPENVIVIDYAAPGIIEDMQTECFIIMPAYSHISTIHYELNEQASVDIQVRDPNGDMISVMTTTVQTQGVHSVEWWANYDSNSIVSVEGDYEVIMTAESTASGKTDTRAANVAIRE